MTEADTTTEATRKSGRRVLAGSSIGGVVEWFDFTIFALTAPILAVVFFPPDAGSGDLFRIFAVYAVAFVARPLGGVIFGQIGDRVGRRPALAASIVLMGAATAGIGLLPSYESIGVAAPMLLIVARLIQGLSAGGELTGALTFTFEHAPDGRRGRWVSIVSATAMLGVAGAAVLIMALRLGANDWFEAGGWRWAFVLGGAVAVVGLYLRSKVDETPEFKTARREVPDVRPFRELVGEHRQLLLVQFAFFTVTGIMTHLLIGYIPSYLALVTDLTPTQSNIAFIAGALSVAVIGISIGRMVDRIGWLQLVRGGLLWTIVATIPAFLLIGSGSLLGVIVGVALLGSAVGVYYGCVIATLDIVPAHVRFSGTALPYNVAYAVFAGTAPLVSTWLIDVSGSVLSPAIYATALVVAAAPVLFAYLPTVRARKLEFDASVAGRDLSVERDSRKARSD